MTMPQCGPKNPPRRSGDMIPKWIPGASRETMFQRLRWDQNLDSSRDCAKVGSTGGNFGNWRESYGGHPFTTILREASGRHLAPRKHAEDTEETTTPRKHPGNPKEVTRRPEGSWCQNATTSWNLFILCEGTTIWCCESGAHQVSPSRNKCNGNPTPSPQQPPTPRKIRQNSFSRS